MNKEIIKMGNNEILQDSLLNTLADDITNLIEEARNSSINLLSSMVVQTYWNVGKYIVEFEQKGNAKAKYGSALLTNLSKILTLKLGTGYSHPNLNNMRKFYLFYPNLSDMSNKLTWSHVCELVKIDDALERSFYEKECVKENWNVRSLRRQMDSGLFLRLAASKDKEGILVPKLSENLTEQQKKTKIKNILQILKRTGKIKPDGKEWIMSNLDEI